MNIFKEGITEKILLSVVLLVVVAFFFVFNGQEDNQVLLPDKEAEPVAGVPADSSGIAALEKSLEEKIATNLKSISGVGETKVMVTYQAGLWKEYARNGSTTKRTSKETDKEGGVRETEEITENNTLVLAGNNGPVLMVERRPEVAGVLIIAQGASNPKIKEQIFESVKTLLGIQPSKISVVPLGGV